ncbi:leucine-rich repeat flightless-interacting protein 1 isoform X3 [Spea bombifrons]|uniref:leucine-rich repeat flightless-interacting protein 1 isoform X3 n=1 Tax=Spea bombifrons TaxID=233779 RepID=UPI00234950D5|nr:leucine-rich repeat flightless-interacting protein 1 isoform X3 [Spea bombifrons]
MGTQGPGRKRHPNREGLSAEDHALNQIAREAELRLAAKRAARAEAREIRMKELERQQKEIYQVQKKYYGLDTKWGDIEQWMEDSERYSHRLRRNPQAPDEDDVMSVGSRSSLRTNGYEDELLGASQYRKSSRSTYYSDPSLASTPLTSKPQQAMHNGSRPSLLNCNTLPSKSQRGSVYDESVTGGSRRYSSSSSRPPSEYSCYLGSGSRASSRASSARASPVSSEAPGVPMLRRGSTCGSVSSLGLLDTGSIPSIHGVEERPDKDFAEKGSRPASSLSAATLASLGGTSSRRGSGDTSISVDTEASIREIKEISELKEQIDDVEGKYMQGLKEMKDSLVEVEEKYKRSMVTNAQLDNEKSSLQYQVDTLREVLLELEEELAESRRQYEDKHKECERHKHEQNVLRFQLSEIKGALEQREELLTEIRQLQQKQERSDHEICDLKETIEWKDKKIGALERQKEFFDPVRNERDELREEVSRLKEALKKHGIALDLEGNTNGHSSLEPHINDDSHDPSVKEASLGKTNEAEVKKEVISSQGSQVKEIASEELSRNEESKENAKEHREYEIANDKSVKLADVVNDNGTLGMLQVCSSQQHEGPETDLKDMSSEGECERIDEVDKEIHLGTVELERERTQNNRGVSPLGSEVFQDALDFVEPMPEATSGLQETSNCCQSVCTDVDKEGKVSEQEVTSEDVIRCDVQCTASESSVDQKEVVNASQSKPEASTEESDEAGSTKSLFPEACENLKSSQDDIVAKLGTKEFEDTEKETSSSSDGSFKEIEDQVCACDELDVGQKPIELENCGPESEHVGHENILQDPETKIIQGITGESSDVLSNLEVEKPVIAAEGTGVTADTEEAKLDTDKTDISIGQSPQEIALENKNVHLDDSETYKDKDVPDTVANESTNVQDKKVDKGLYMESVSGQEDERKESQGDVVALETDLGCNIEDRKTEECSVEEDTSEFKEHQKKVITQDEVVEPDSDVNKRLSSTQSVGEHQNETLSSEEETSQEETDSDDKEDYHGPSEKYPGESDIPRSQIGSSVDQTSSRENIHAEESTEKVVRMGKGKNKEDCVVS